MDTRPIRTEEDHRAALGEIEARWGETEGTEDGDKLELLVTLVELYEAKRWPVETESFDVPFPRGGTAGGMPVDLGLDLCSCLASEEVAVEKLHD